MFTHMELTICRKKARCCPSVFALQIGIVNNERCFILFIKNAPFRKEWCVLFNGISSPYDIWLSFLIMRWILFSAKILRISQLYNTQKLVFCNKHFNYILWNRIWSVSVIQNKSPLQFFSAIITALQEQIHLRWNQHSTTERKRTTCLYQKKYCCVFGLVERQLSTSVVGTSLRHLRLLCGVQSAR